MRNLAVMARRAIVGALAASLAVLAVTAPAHAAANPSTLTFTNGNELVPNLGDSAPYVEGRVGDTFTFRNDNLSDVSLLNSDTSNALVRVEGQICNDASTNCIIPAGASRTVEIIGLDEIFGDGVNVIQGPFNRGTFYVIPGPSAEASTTASGPAAVIQQFGFPASGDCDAAAPAGLDWAGVSPGGWEPSWATWINDGRGGAVCTRTLAYRYGLQRWVVE